MKKGLESLQEGLLVLQRGLLQRSGSLVCSATLTFPPACGSSSVTGDASTVGPQKESILGDMGGPACWARAGKETVMDEVDEAEPTSQESFIQ